MKSDRNIADLDSEELIALRNEIDARLEQLRITITEQAQRLGLVVKNGKTKRPRKPRNQSQELE